MRAAEGWPSPTLLGMRIPLARVVTYLLALAATFAVAGVIGAQRWTESRCGSPNFAGECTGAPIAGVFWGLLADGAVVVLIVLVEAYLRLPSRQRDRLS